MMEQDKSCITKSILNLTLEIIYLLTGEDYLPANNSRKHLTSTMHTQVSDEQCRTPKQISDERILELTNKIIELLSGEVPIRCQDVAVYFSVAEWEYLEKHKDLYKDVMMEDHQPFTSSDVFQTTNIPGSYNLNSSLDSVIDYRNPSNIQTANHLLYEPNTINYLEKVSERSPLGEEAKAINRIKDRPQFSSIHVCKEPASYDRWSLTATDLYIPTDHTPYDPLTHIKEESISCNVEDLSNMNSTSDLVYTHRQIKKESVSSNKDNIEETDTDIYTLADHPQRDPSLNMKEKPDSCEQNISAISSNINIIHHISSTGEYITYYRKNNPADKLFFCSECGKSFNRNSYLISHQRSHTGEKPYSCPECGKRFMRSSHLVRHKRIHTGEKPHSCSECGKRFITTSDLVIHQRTHTGERPYHCSECGKSFICNSVLIKHLRTHTGEKRHCCPECGKYFTTNAYLVVHQRIHTGERPFPCTECGKSFTCNSVLTKHQKIHAERNSESDMSTHNRSQARQELYSCNQRGDIFKNNTQFLSHQESHLGDANTEFELDGQHTNHEGEKANFCWDCGKCFANKRCLVLHQRRHITEKPYTCMECGECFTERGYLGRHLESHQR